jgi:hypothetical protein
MKKDSAQSAILKTVEKNRQSPRGTDPFGANLFIDYILDATHLL